MTVSGVSNPIPEHSHEVSQPDSFCNSDNKSVRGDQILKEPNEIPSNLNSGALPEPHKALENIRRKNINRLIFAQLNLILLFLQYNFIRRFVQPHTDWIDT